MQELYAAIEEKNIEKIKKIMQDNDLILDGNKIIPKNKKKLQEESEYWDTMQYLRK